ncbi:MAG: alpha-L-rhamnosidase N-terminal domain-containing protein [Candidatus Brocadiia bacterium]
MLFRKEIEFEEIPEKATGWITADSRYLLTVNGQRVQWGPAPADPRWPDLDPLELCTFLRPGKNVIGIEVLFYGHDEGTWAMGKPGVVFSLTCKWPGGREEKVFTDGDWKCHLDRSYKPGQPKRCFLRALQEEFDARSYPEGWDSPPILSWAPLSFGPRSAIRGIVCRLRHRAAVNVNCVFRSQRSWICRKSAQLFGPD